MLVLKLFLDSGVATCIGWSGVFVIFLLEVVELLLDSFLSGFRLRDLLL